MELDADAYRLLFDATPLPIFVSDRETLQILVVNKAACEHYGYSRDEFLAMTLRDIRPAEEMRTFEASFADPTKDTRPTYSRIARHRTKDGRIIDVTLEIARVVIGGRVAGMAVVTDVTGIAQAERRFRLLVEHSTDGIATINAQNIIEYVSPAGAKVLGYTPEEMIGTPSGSRSHPEDSPSWIAPAPGETRHHVARLAHRDGSWRWIESSTTNFTHEPAVRAYVSNYRDITARKQAEQALLESQRRMEFLLSATSAVTWTARATGEIAATYMSPNVQDVLGYQPGVFLTQPGFWFEHIHPEDRALVTEQFVELMRTGTMAVQYRFLHSDGSYRWMRDVARVIRDAGGDAVEIVGSWIDVTEQVRADEAVRRSEANFRTLIEHAPTATFVHRNGRYEYLNPAAVALLGYQSASEIVGREVLEFVHPEDREHVKRRIAEVKRDGSTPINAGRMVRADGSVFMIEARGMLLDFDGQPSNVVMGHDITERDEMFARMALADRMLSVGTLAAGVAHEINNPLAYVSANLELLDAELPNITLAGGSRLNAESLRMLVADSREGVERMSTIVRDLRSLSRPDEQSRGPVDVIAVLASSIKMAHNEIRHRARLVTTYDDPIPTVDADPSRLGQVFLNLLLNAAQAIAEGHADKNQVGVRVTTTADARVRIDISDTGMGIAPGVMRRIFDPFFTTKAPGIGTGLGLAISHQLVRAMNGEIAVESSPGTGSTFSVILPVATAQVATTRDARNGAKLAARILLVDDEPAVGRSLSILLAPETEVVAVTRAGDAIARIRRGERFDAILCDLMMPEITGVELYNELARAAPDCASRVIFMTGGAFTPQAREFLASTDRPHLEKPFTEAELRRAIENMAR